MRLVCVILLACEPRMSFAQQASPSPSTVATVSEPKPAPKDATADNSTLDRLLKHDGFMAAKLKQANLDKDPKRLVIDVEINRVSALFEVDTGAGGITIARGSLKKFRLVEQKTSQRVHTLGEKPASNKFWSIARLDTFAIGNCVFHAVPVAIKEIPHCDGFLGSPEMHRFAAVLDCGEHAFYLAPRGPSSRTSSKLAAMLESNGFTQVPLRLTSDHHLEVDCSIDGVPSTILVDTGSQFTLVDESIGSKAGIIMKQPITQVRGRARDNAPQSIGRVKKLAVGDFEIRDADICFMDFKETDSPSPYLLGLLGISELASNSAIIDVGGLSMYLRHPQ
jgi:predicted aspartyl protease